MPATEDGGEDEVALGGAVDDIDEGAAPARFGGDDGVDRRDTAGGMSPGARTLTSEIDIRSRLA